MLTSCCEMTISPDSKGWYSIERSIDHAIVCELEQLSPIEKLSLTKIPLLTVKLAQRLSHLRIEQLWLWCDVTRRAMRHVIQLQGIRVLDVLCIRGPGKLANFDKALDLEVFRANHYMTEVDLLQVVECKQLRELGAQSSELSNKAISAILSLPNLTKLDLESTRFDDRMAAKICHSKTIKSLDIGATRITRWGLAHLIQMEQLESLDLWATDLNEMDLRLLLELPNLEYLSLGNYDGLPQLDPEQITQLVLHCPKLKRVWLDGIRLEVDQKSALEAKLESLQITSLSDAA